MANGRTRELALTLEREATEIRERAKDYPGLRHQYNEMCDRLHALNQKLQHEDAGALPITWEYL